MIFVLFYVFVHFVFVMHLQIYIKALYIFLDSLSILFFNVFMRPVLLDLIVDFK